MELSDEQREFLSENFKLENIDEIFLTKQGEIRKNFTHKNLKIAQEISQIIYKNSINLKKEFSIKRTYSFLKIALLIAIRNRTDSGNKEILQCKTRSCLQYAYKNSAR
ncbi:hypothetical protein FACS1894113_5500 [Alphaproteobacteria bacterium]|nr:hypothetical protein FACS1894113_5500 [Alphaproteobacteria bacterium]